MEFFILHSAKNLMAEHAYYHRSVIPFEQETYGRDTSLLLQTPYDVTNPHVEGHHEFLLPIAGQGLAGVVANPENSAWEALTPMTIEGQKRTASKRQSQKDEKKTE